MMFKHVPNLCPFTLFEILLKLGILDPIKYGGEDFPEQQQEQANGNNSAHHTNGYW